MMSCLALLLLLLLSSLAFCFVAAMNHGVWTNGKPLIGVNTWCDDDICGLFDRCPASLIMEMADGLVNTGMRDVGASLIELDDCWSDTSRDANGNLQPDPTLFPNGLKPVIDYVHSKGLKFGLYLCIGTKTCRKGRPGSFGHYDKDAKWLESLGVDLIKVDNCNRPGGYTEQQLYCNFSHYLNQSSYPIYFSACEWGVGNIEEWGPQCVDSWRVQMDHLCFYWLPTKAAGKGFGQGTWQIIKYIETLPPGKWGSRNFIGDPDFLMTLFKPTMTFIQSRTEFSFWSLWSSPLVMATRDYNISQEKAAIVLNKAVIAIDQDDLVIPGWKAYNNSDNSGQIWIKPLAAHGGNSAAVLFWNRLVFSTTNVSFTINWRDTLGFNVDTDDTDATLLVFDLWSSDPNHGVEVSANQTYSVSDVVPEDVKLLKVICPNGPCLKGWWN